MSIAWTIETHPTVHSTQDIIKGMARIEQPEGMVVHALEQTNGRGRHGRIWTSHKGNLFMSVLLKPSCPVRHIGQLSMVSGLAVLSAIRKFVRNTAKPVLKWPNDVLIEGDKCAGILLETELTQGQSVKWLALGLGVNVISAPPGLGTCLKDHATKPPGLDILRNEILKQLGQYYTQWSREGFAQIREDWLKNTYQKGQKIQVKIGPQIEEGNFYGLDDYGNLLLSDRDLRLKTVSAGEVYS